MDAERWILWPGHDYQAGVVPQTTDYTELPEGTNLIEAEHPDAGHMTTKWVNIVLVIYGMGLYTTNHTVPPYSVSSMSSLGKPRKNENHLLNRAIAKLQQRGVSRPFGIVPVFIQ